MRICFHSCYYYTVVVVIDGVAVAVAAVAAVLLFADRGLHNVTFILRLLCACVYQKFIKR